MLFVYLTLFSNAQILSVLLGKIVGKEIDADREDKFDRSNIYTYIYHTLLTFMELNRHCFASSALGRNPCRHISRYISCFILKFAFNCLPSIFIIFYIPY